MLDKLNKEDRLRLMKFVCSFAWADLEIQPSEREFVGKLVDKLDFDEDEKTMVEGWLRVPPRPEEVDPMQIPSAHRQLFLDTARAMIVVDGRVDAEEQENLDLLEQLVQM